ncbi:MAG: glycosyltransferase family 9 protein [Chitinophagaceae bacterium]|nr:glycosyltransferase family 9 protein [Chitinophagaceae bacterium]
MDGFSNCINIESEYNAVTLRYKQQLDKYLGNFLIAIHLVAARILGFILRRNHTLQPAPEHILFIKIMGIGSVLMAADGILAIRNKYPDAKLILLGNPSVISGIRPAGLFDEYWAYHDTSFLKAAGSTIKNLFRSWQKRKLWVCNMEVYSKLTTIFSLWTCARNRFDFFFNEVSFRKNINTHPVYFNQFSLAHENYDRMAEALGAEIKISFEFDDHAKAGRALSGRKYIIISNTCSELARERLYPDDLLVQLCIHLFQKYHCPLLLSGTKADRSYYDRLLQNNLLKEVPVQNIAGDHSMEAFISLLYTDCRLLVTVDSAPLHFAFRLGVPAVSLWGPTHPATRMKESRLFKAVYLSVDCSPCAHHTTVLPCGGNNICMKNMTPALVMQKVGEVMSNLNG